MSTAIGVETTEVTAAQGEQTILAERGYIWGLLVYTDGTNAAVASLYDGTVAGGNRKLRVDCSGSNRFAGVVLDRPIAVTTSLNAAVTGTGSACMVLFSK